MPGGLSQEHRDEREFGKTTWFINFWTFICPEHFLLSISTRCSGWELLCVFIRWYFSSQIHDSTSKFPFFWKRGKNLLLILQLAGARSLWAEIAENLLGTLETIFNGRRHRNDFNILRSMGNSSPTITVSHLGGGMNRKNALKNEIWPCWEMLIFWGEIAVKSHCVGSLIYFGFELPPNRNFSQNCNWAWNNWENNWKCIRSSRIYSIYFTKKRKIEDIF